MYTELHYSDLGAYITHANRIDEVVKQHKWHKQWHKQGYRNKSTVDTYKQLLFYLGLPFVYNDY